jgi:hypothetical protein
MKNAHPYAIAALAALLLLLLDVVAARAQVWVDATQLGDRKPDWVDARYYQPAPPEPAPHPIVTKRIWHEPVYQIICDRLWVEGHFECRTVTAYDPCDCPIIREERIWVPGHYRTIERRVCISPGYWETITYCN